MIENLSSRAARCASFSIAGSCLLLFALAAKAEPVSVKVTIQNLAPANGTYLTPLWVGFHNGTFRLYTTGAPVSPSFERLVEDGNTDSISLLFRTSAAGIGGKDGVIIGPTMPGAIAPGVKNLISFLGETIPGPITLPAPGFMAPISNGFCGFAISPNTPAGVLLVRAAARSGLQSTLTLPETAH